MTASEDDWLTSCHQCGCYQHTPGNLARSQQRSCLMHSLMHIN